MNEPSWVAARNCVTAHRLCRFLRFQKDSALGPWYRARTEGAAEGLSHITKVYALAFF